MILIKRSFFSLIDACDFSHSLCDLLMGRPSIPMRSKVVHHFSTVRLPRPIFWHISDTVWPDERPSNATLTSHFRRSCDRCQLLSKAQSIGVTVISFPFALDIRPRPRSDRQAA